MNDMWVAYSWMAVSVASFGGWWLYLHYRRKDRALSGRAEMERLEARVQDLEQEVGTLVTDYHDRLEQLHERVDFAERILLERTRERRELARGVESEVPTPV